jgi:hypothetical protein
VSLYDDILRKKNEEADAFAQESSPSKRLQMQAEVGGMVRSYGRVENDFIAFHDRILKIPQLVNQPTVMLAVANKDEAAYREAIHTFHLFGSWAQNGFSLFDVSPDLAAALLLTDPPPTPETGLKLPFSCFCIRLPEGTIPIFLGDKQVWAEQLWAHQFWGIHKVEGRKEYIRVSAVWQGLQFWRDRWVGNLDLDSDESVYNRVMQGDPPILPEDEISANVMMRFFKSFISWLHATNALEKTKPEIPRLKKKASKEARMKLESGFFPRVWLIGREVKLRPELKRMARETALGGSKRHEVAGWKVRTRHIVRGHFKPRLEARLGHPVWVEPYWRGPEGEAAWAHIYTDKEPPK